MRCASSSPTGMGVSTWLEGSAAARHPQCVLVTDGDGSLNVMVTDYRNQDKECVLVTDGDGSLNASRRESRLAPGRVRPRHRRGWESQPRPHVGRVRNRAGASSSPTGMGVSTRSRRRLGRPRGRASSSPTGMGVSTKRRPTCGTCRTVRPRHRRGWESQRYGDRRRVRRRECVLVTDGDGSLNDTAGKPVGLARMRASSSPTGMGVSTYMSRIGKK